MTTRRTYLQLAPAALTLAILLLPAGHCRTAGEPTKGRLFFVGVAYDASPPPSKDVNDYNYASGNFSDLLMRSGEELFSEVRVLTVLGKEVTNRNVMALLRAVRKAASKHDLVFLYWGTHGVTGADGWSTTGADGVAITGDELRVALGSFPCPVIIAVSTCSSAGFVRPGHKDPLPHNVSAFCACRRHKTTVNQLDVALCEALAGFADSDSDGFVTLREVTKYVPRRYHEWSPDEKTRATNDLPVLDVHDPSALDRPLAKASPDRVAVEVDGRWYGALKMGERKGKPLVRFLGYDHTSRNGTFSMPDRLAEPERVIAADGPPAVMAEWRGEWLPATVLERRGRQLKVHYVGYPSSDDELVRRNRIHPEFGLRDLRAVKLAK